MWSQKLKNAFVKKLRHTTSQLRFGVEFGRISSFSEAKETLYKKPFLFVSFFDPQGISAVIDYCSTFCRIFPFKIDLLNLHGGDFSSGLYLPPSLNIDDYAGLIIHSPVSYNPANLFSMDSRVRGGFKTYKGLKILLKQDEHFRTNEVNRFLKFADFDVLSTVAPAFAVSQLYESSVLEKIEVVPSLTGYVDKKLLGFEPVPFSLRTKEVSYRGSLAPFYFGKVAYEKSQIGEAFLAATQHTELRTDISSRLEDRIGGDAWLRFLATSRATLGVESGASIVDFDGQVERETTDFLKKSPGANFDVVFEKVLKKYEGNVRYLTISPRHLEAAATGTVQIMYEGDFGGHLQAHKHYFPLNRDFSNLRDCLDFLNSSDQVLQMSLQIRKDILFNDKYNFSHFVNLIAQAIERARIRRDQGRSSRNS